MTAREWRQPVLIGPGRVGTALAMSLPVPLRAVAGRTAASLDAFHARFPEVEALDAVEAAPLGDLVLVCVPDDSLVEIVRGLAAAGAVRKGSRWVHVAGGHGVGALRPARLAGARVAACHPAQTFPDADTGRAALPDTAWAVTAAPADLPWARALVEDCGGRPFVVAEASRVLYHAGLSVGANATSAVVTLARDLLRGAGIKDPAAFLAPLAVTSAANAAASGAAALTGPVRRGDAGTLAAHLAELETALPEAVDVYRALARLALGYARRAGLDAERAAAVAALLDVS